MMIYIFNNRNLNYYKSNYNKRIKLFYAKANKTTKRKPIIYQYEQNQSEKIRNNIKTCLSIYKREKTDKTISYPSNEIKSYVKLITKNNPPKY